jgi:hypothetical protein
MPADQNDVETGGIAASAVSPELVAAYRGALYRIEAADGAFTVRVGGADPRLDRILAAHGVAVAALVTAHNPEGRRASDAANRAGEAGLAARIAALGLASLPTAGIDPSGVWPEEPGRLILGLDRAGGIALARGFGQDALLIVRIGVGPELVMAR